MAVGNLVGQVRGRNGDRKAVVSDVRKRVVREQHRRERGSPRALRLRCQNSYRRVQSQKFIPNEELARAKSGQSAEMCQDVPVSVSLRAEYHDVASAACTDSRVNAGPTPYLDVSSNG